MISVTDHDGRHGIRSGIPICRDKASAMGRNTRQLVSWLGIVGGGL